MTDSPGAKKMREVAERIFLEMDENKSGGDKNRSYGVSSLCAKILYQIPRFLWIRETCQSKITGEYCYKCYTVKKYFFSLRCCLY